jgi:glycosyltransferase involved in cell wall biosynthesis
MNPVVESGHPLQEPPRSGQETRSYSVCMLCSNDGETVEASVRSVLELSQYRNTEVIVVDNLSTDRSADSLRKLRDEGLITLIEQRCKRGEGRQLAFNASKGKYVLSHMDCDDIFDAAGIDSLIARYHAEFEGRALMTKKRDSPEASNITIAPRLVIEQVGGWRPLNWGEDWDLWARLASIGVYSFTPYPVQSPPHKTIKVRTERYAGPTRGFGVRVSKYMDAIRMGRKVFDPGEHVSLVQKMALATAKVRMATKGESLFPVPNPGFAEFTSSGKSSTVPTYSVCMTCYNEASTVRESLNSLLDQLDDDYEVVIIDNYSEDGTYEVLKEFEKLHGVKVVQEKSSRGQGREFALEHASGQYVIANLDLDDVFHPVLKEIVKGYHAKAEGMVLAIFNSSPPPDLDTGWVQNITISPRELLGTLGGWRNLDLFEDWDLWSRADRVQKYAWSSFRFASNVTLHPETKHAVSRLKSRYQRYLCRLRLGMKIFSPGEKVGLSQRIAYVGARLTVLYRGVLKGQDPGFKSLDARLYVDLGGHELEGDMEEQTALPETPQPKS